MNGIEYLRYDDPGKSTSESFPLFTLQGPWSIFSLTPALVKWESSTIAYLIPSSDKTPIREGSHTLSGIQLPEVLAPKTVSAIALFIRSCPCLSCSGITVMIGSEYAPFIISMPPDATSSRTDPIYSGCLSSIHSIMFPEKWNEVFIPGNAFSVSTRGRYASS